MAQNSAMSTGGMDLNSRRDILRMGAIFYELVFNSTAFENYDVFIEEISSGKCPSYLFPADCILDDFTKEWISAVIDKTFRANPPTASQLDEEFSGWRRKYSDFPPVPYLRIVDDFESSLESDLLGNVIYGVIQVRWSSCNPDGISQSLSLTYESGENPVVIGETVELYLHRTWDKIGDLALKLWIKVLKSRGLDLLYLGRFSLVEPDSYIEVFTKGEWLTVSAVCPMVDLSRLRECLVWLEQVTGFPDQGLQTKAPRAVCQQRPYAPDALDLPARHFADSQHDLDNPLFRLKSLAEHSILVIDFHKGQSVEGLELYSLCWRDLLHSAYVAERPGYVPHHQGIGLQLSFDLMLELVALERAIVYDGGLILTGYDTAVVPTRLMDDSVQWHVVFQGESRDGRKTWFPEDQPCPFDLENRLKVTSLDELKRTAYLGWGDRVEVVLGTESLPRHPFVGRTELETLSVHRFVNTGYSRGGTFGISLGPANRILNANVNGAGSLTYTYSRDRPCQTKSLPDNYKRRFWHLYRSVVVIYDVHAGRAWLLPKVNVVLHLVRMYMALARLQAPLTIPYPRQRDEDREALDIDAWDVIRKLELKKIETDEDMISRSPETFGALFNDFAEFLHLALAPMEASSFPETYGVELLDVYDGNFGLLKKVSPVHGTERTWPLLLDRVGVIVCRGLGAALHLTPEMKQAESECFLYRSHTLCTTLGDLKLLMTSQGCSEWEGGYIERSGVWTWILDRDPLNPRCQGNDGHSCSGTCLEKKVQRLQKQSCRGQKIVQRFALKDMNSGICFQ